MFRVIYEILHQMKKYFNTAKFIFNTKIVLQKKLASHKRIKEQYKNLVTPKYLQAVFIIFWCSVTEI